jgi:broad specificity phosphatase PhoE
MLQLIIARHGQSEGDTKALVEGSADLPLTATGQLQGHLLAERVKRDFRGTAAPTVVFTSPLRRANDIAQAIAAHLEIPLIADPRLAEISTGIAAGVAVAEAARRWPLPARGHLAFERFPGGESEIDLYARVAEFTLNLLDVAGEPFPGVWGRRTVCFEGECESTRDMAPWEDRLKAALRRPAICLIAHGGTIGKLLWVLFGLPPNSQVRFPHGDTGLTEVVIGDGRVRVLRMNCQRHLPEILRGPGERDIAAADPEGVAEAVARHRQAAGHDSGDPAAEASMGQAAGRRGGPGHG